MPSRRGREDVGRRESLVEGLADRAEEIIAKSTLPGVCFFRRRKNESRKHGVDKVRHKCASVLNLIGPKAHAVLWVTDFPMFEYNEDEERFEACHHPFTAPNRKITRKTQTI